MTVKGVPQLNARLRAIRTAFKPVGRQWGEKTVDKARQRVRVGRTGRTRGSIRIASATQRRAIVAAAFGARFLEAGTQAHTVKPNKRRGKRAMKFGEGGNTVFARKANQPAKRKRPFLHDSATQALADTPLARDLIDQWNRAA